MNGLLEARVRSRLIENWNGNGNFVAIISMNGMHLRTQLEMKYKSLITKHILYAQ